MVAPLLKFQAVPVVVWPSKSKKMRLVAPGLLCSKNSPAGTKRISKPSKQGLLKKLFFLVALRLKKFMATTL